MATVQRRLIRQRQASEIRAGGAAGGVTENGGMTVAHREQLNDEQRRLLRITARMPLASVANLAPVLGLEEERVRGMLGTLRGCVTKCN